MNIALKEYLSSDIGVAAMVGSRIGNEKIDQTTGFSKINIRLIDGGIRDACFDRVASHRTYMYQIECQGSYNLSGSDIAQIKARNLLRVVELAMDKLHANVGPIGTTERVGVKSLKCLDGSGGSRFESNPTTPPTAGSESLYTYFLTYEITFQYLDIVSGTTLLIDMTEEDIQTYSNSPSNITGIALPDLVAVEFPGTDDGFDLIAERSRIELIDTDPWSITFWIKNLLSIDKDVIRYGTAAQNGDTDNTFVAGIRSGGEVRLKTNALNHDTVATINDETWHLITFANDATSLLVYVDKVLDSTLTAVASDFSSAVTEFKILDSEGIVKLDALRFSNKKLTLEEHVLIFNNQFLAAPETAQIPPPAAPTDYQNFYEFGDSGGTFEEDTAANQDLINAGATQFTDPTQGKMAQFQASVPPEEQMNNMGWIAGDVDKSLTAVILIDNDTAASSLFGFDGGGGGSIDLFTNGDIEILNLTDFLAFETSGLVGAGQKFSLGISISSGFVYRVFINGVESTTGAQAGTETLILDTISVSKLIAKLAKVRIYPRLLTATEFAAVDEVDRKVA